MAGNGRIHQALSQLIGPLLPDNDAD
jgi:hypothetical protein